ncbi:uncharacterized protein KIAA2012 homolog isoform X3 [Sparus aurata]|uniref:uncharacterized protein KIAA2012 homolog isoform X3 n=1 Tax=Sparus aurata TaxID=8175 RepID=UPI0011C0E02C|nr:uncharacterized protein KIAA2012-like isoform X3 [Sparus aurata]
MKDLSLSLLSRGCGRFVSTGRYDGRLDVFLTPQDYYIWKSQVSFLQVSNRGHLHVETESTLPKTYSTRRGPLLLYSQDLVTLETSCHSWTRDRKQRVVRRYTRRVEPDLGTVKELTAAILSYSKNEFISSRLGPPFFPPFHLAPVPDLHRPSPPPIHTTQEQSSQELLVGLNTEWLPAEPNAQQDENQPKDEEEEQWKRIRQDVFLQVPCISRAPSPQIQHQPCARSDSMISDEEPQTYSDMSQQHTEVSRQTEVNTHSLGGELHHPNMICVPDMADDQNCSNQNSETTSDNGNYERSVNANRHGLLPPLTERHSVCHGPCWEKTGRPRLKGTSSDEHFAQPLPPIAESCAVDPGWAVRAQTQKAARPSAETFGCQSQENLNRLHQQLLFPPLLFPGKEEEINGKQRGRGEKQTERQNFKKDPEVQGGGGGGGGGGRLPSEKGSVILLEPGEEPPPPVGVLGCVAGWRGLGKQSSLAFLQNPLSDLQDPCEANRGVVRGIVPLELRDLQNGKSVGSLILGPDGEIIQLSLYDSSHNPPQGACDTQEQALQVLSAEGETLPWVIVLQPENTQAACAEGEVELNTDVPEGDIQQHQSELVDLQSDKNAYTPSRHTDPVAVTQEKKSPEAVGETRKAPKKDAKNNVRLPPLREPRRGHAEAEEDDKQEERGGTQQSSHLSGSHQPSLPREKLQVKDDASSFSEQNINSKEARTEDAVDQKRRNTKRRDTQDVKTVSADTEGQKTSRTRKEGRRQRHKTESDAAQSTRSQKQEEKTNREAAETKKQSALPPEKKTTHRQEEMEAKVNREKEEQGEVTGQKEDSDGRRRRGRLKHKELVTDNHGKEELDINKEMEEGSHLKYTKRSSATQRSNNKTETKSESLNPEEDTDRDHLSSSADRHSSVQSVSSLRSTAAASRSSQRSRRRSADSPCEGAVPTSATGLALSRGRLSSCSTVMVTEEQLMLNTVKPESSRPRKSEEKEEEEAAALRLAQRAERRRLEVERKRREREEEERKQQEREQNEERMKSELEEERRKKAEELRLKRLAEEEERRKREEEEQERARREQAQRERERRRQEERRRQMEQFQRMREEEEQKRKAELELLRLEEQRRQEEESKKLQEMDESERTEYLRRKEQEKEDRRNKEEERRRTEEEAALQAAEEDRLRAELLARQMALLQQQLAFKRGLMFEAEGLEKSQGISRPWIYSYFSLLELLGLSSATAGTSTP